MRRQDLIRQMFRIISDGVLPRMPPEVLLEIAAVRETNCFADFVILLEPYEDTTEMLLLKAWAMFGQVQEGIHIDDVYLDMLRARALFNEALERDDIDDVLPVPKRRQYRANFNTELARVKRFAIKHGMPLERAPVPPAPKSKPEMSVAIPTNETPSAKSGWITRLFGR